MRTPDNTQVALITLGPRVCGLAAGASRIRTVGPPPELVPPARPKSMLKARAVDGQPWPNAFDPHQVRDVPMDWPARLLDQRAGPKGAGYVVQYLGVELLPAEPGAAAPVFWTAG